MGTFARKTGPKADSAFESSSQRSRRTADATTATAVALLSFGCATDEAQFVQWPQNEPILSFLVPVRGGVLGDPVGPFLSGADSNLDPQSFAVDPNSSDRVVYVGISRAALMQAAPLAITDQLDQARLRSVAVADECKEGALDGDSLVTPMPANAEILASAGGPFVSPGDAEALAASLSLSVPIEEARCVDQEITASPFGDRPLLLPEGSSVFGMVRETAPDRGNYLRFHDVAWIDASTIVALSSAGLYVLSRNEPYEDGSTPALRFASDPLTAGGAGRRVAVRHNADGSATGFVAMNEPQNEAGISSGKVVEVHFDGAEHMPRPVRLSEVSQELLDIAVDAGGRIVAVGVAGLVATSTGGSFTERSFQFESIERVIPGTERYPHILGLNHGNVALGDAFFPERLENRLLLVSSAAASLALVEGAEATELWVGNGRGWLVHSPIDEDAFVTTVPALLPSAAATCHTTTVDSCGFHRVADVVVDLIPRGEDELIVVWGPCSNLLVFNRARGCVETIEVAGADVLRATDEARFRGSEVYEGRAVIVGDLGATYEIEL